MKSNSNEKHLHATNLMSSVIATKTLDLAFKFIYKARIENSANSDIWEISTNWPKYRELLQTQVLTNNFYLSPVECFISSKTNKLITRWSSLDSILLKAISMTIAPVVKKFVGPNCIHLAGNGGTTAGVIAATQAAKNYKYVIKSDVANFYDSSEHHIVLREVQKVIKDRKIINIIQQVLNRCEIQNANHLIIECGIPMGCSISPLLGALMLKTLDDSLNEVGVFYIRYMDDWLVFTNQRKQLRRLVIKMHKTMHQLKYKLAVLKTYIGKVCRGFDFLGRRFNHNGLIGIAVASMSNFCDNLRRLYEQNASENRIAAYVTRWQRWAG